MFSWLFAASIPLTSGFYSELDFNSTLPCDSSGGLFCSMAFPAVPFFLGSLCLSLAMAHLLTTSAAFTVVDLAGAASAACS